MSSILHEDTFHGTKKGGRRKTVSKRRAYVNTPSNIKRQLQIIEMFVRKIRTASIPSANARTKAISHLLDLQDKL